MPLALAAAAAVAVLDQLSKWWIVDSVMDPPRTIEVTGFFNLVLTYNPGISFGLLSTDAALVPWLLSGLAVAIVIGLVFWLRRIEGHWPGVAVGFIIGGVVGNPPRIRQLAMQPGDVQRTWADLTRSRAELGYEPKTSFEDGLKRQWAWTESVGIEGSVSSAP